MVWADTSGTITLNSGQNFNLDAGSVVSSGGDVQLTGSAITYQGSAKGGVIPGFAGSTAYSQITQAILQSLASLASTAPTPVSSLTAGMTNGSIIGVETNSGKGAKLLVTAVGSSSLSFQYTTFGAASGGGGSGGGVPTITQILNNYSLTPAGFTNSGIAQGARFIIKGSGLADPNAQATPLQDSSKGLPATLNGATSRSWMRAAQRSLPCSITPLLRSWLSCCRRTRPSARLR